MEGFAITVACIKNFRYYSSSSVSGLSRKNSSIFLMAEKSIDFVGIFGDVAFTRASHDSAEVMAAAAYVVPDLQESFCQRGKF